MNPVTPAAERIAHLLGLADLVDDPAHQSASRKEIVEALREAAQEIERLTGDLKFACDSCEAWATNYRELQDKYAAER